MTYQTLVVKDLYGLNPKNKFVRFQFSPGHPCVYYHCTPEIVPGDWTMELIRHYLAGAKAPASEMAKLDNCELVECEVILKV